MIPVKASEVREEQSSPLAATSVRMVNGQAVRLRGGLPVQDTVLLLPGGRRVVWERHGRVRSL